LLCLSSALHCSSVCFGLLFLLVHGFPLFFFLRIRPPPSPTLFPYTTLFRSISAILLPTGVLLLIAPLLLTMEEAHPAWFLGVVVDRKSTRLNSSHEWISYAVFCLKKKRT